MLLELEIQDFAIIERVHCRFEPGFNVLTGETGAGKSIVVDALALLLGERADTTAVREGAERAVVQGVFEPGHAATSVGSVLEAYGVPRDDLLLLGREVLATGRSIARINGRVVPVRALAEVGHLLGDMHGQGEATSLKRETEHIELLDRFAGLSAEREVLAAHVAALHQLRREVEALTRDEAELARRADTLSFQVEEISLARPTPGEEEDLLAERARLSNSEKLAVLADKAYAAMRDPGDGRDGGVDLLGEALEALEALVRIDPTLADVRDALTAAVDMLSERASELLAYRDALAFDPPRLEQVEDRLALIAGLKRKYGPDIPSVLAYGQAAAEELSRLTGAGARLAELQAGEASLRDEIGLAAAALSRRRAEAGERLGAAVASEMAKLGMAGSRFVVALERRDAPDGVPVDGRHVAFDAKGIDRVAFLVSANPGEPPRPLVSVASGGETSRIMLALKSVLQSADLVPVLVFDEIDAGIGGRIGGVVGRRLWSLTDRHQVMCVTHLPQVAAYGDVHWHVRKSIVAGRTVTEVARLAEEDRVHEITQMLGTGSDAGRESAAQLLEQAEAWKQARDAAPPVGA